MVYLLHPQKYRLHELENRTPSLPDWWNRVFCRLPTICQSRHTISIRIFRFPAAVTTRTQQCNEAQPVYLCICIEFSICVVSKLDAILYHSTHCITIIHSKRRGLDIEFKDITYSNDTFCESQYKADMSKLLFMLFSIGFVLHSTALSQSRSDAQTEVKPLREKILATQFSLTLLISHGWWLSQNDGAPLETLGLWLGAICMGLSLPLLYWVHQSLGAYFSARLVCNLYTPSFKMVHTDGFVTQCTAWASCT